MRVRQDRNRLRVFVLNGIAKLYRDLERFCTRQQCRNSGFPTAMFPCIESIKIAVAVSTSRAAVANERFRAS